VAGLAETIEAARLNGSQPVMPPLRRKPLKELFTGKLKD
jgi:hypothetical protein